MLIRSLTLAILLAAAGPLLAADSDAPLTQDQGKYRPLIIITRTPVDPTLVNLKKPWMSRPTAQPSLSATWCSTPWST